MENWRFYPYESKFFPRGQTSGMLLTFRGVKSPEQGGQMKSEQGGQVDRNIHWAREAKVRIKKKAISGDFMNYKSVDRIIELQVSRVGEQFRLK
jgi:hypothetical protein